MTTMTVLLDYSANLLARMAAKMLYIGRWLKVLWNFKCLSVLNEDYVTTFPIYRDLVTVIQIIYIYSSIAVVLLLYICIYFRGLHWVWD